MLRYVEDGDDVDTIRGIDCVMLHEHGIYLGPFRKNAECLNGRKKAERRLSDMPMDLEMVVAWMSDRCQVRVRLSIYDMRTTENELVNKISMYVFECLLQPAKSQEVS